MSRRFLDTWPRAVAGLAIAIGVAMAVIGIAHVNERAQRDQRHIEALIAARDANAQDAARFRFMLRDFDANTRQEMAREIDVEMARVKAEESTP